MCFITRSVILFCLTAAQIAVMITNGRSDDQVDAAAAAVADGGISLFAVGECGSGDAAVSLLLLPTYQVEFFFFFCLGSDSLSAPFAVRYSSPEHLNSQCCCKIVFLHEWAMAEYFAALRCKNCHFGCWVCQEGAILSPSLITRCCLPANLLPHIQRWEKITQQKPHELLLSAGGAAIITAH